MSEPEQITRIITEEDVVSGKHTLLESVSRFAARGVLLDEYGRAVMMHMRSNGFHKLPGGGVEQHEDARAAFRREILEETGYPCRILRPIGIVQEHKARNQFFQFSYCFLAKTAGSAGKCHLTRSERELEFTAIKMPVHDAVETVREDFARCVEYGMRFMLYRDLAILTRAENIIKSL